MVKVRPNRVRRIGITLKEQEFGAQKRAFERSDQALQVYDVGLLILINCTMIGMFQKRTSDALKKGVIHKKRNELLHSRKHNF